jgi:hypothetical protein
MAVGLGEMDQIHPESRCAFTVVGRSEEAIDQPFIGI